MQRLIVLLIVVALGWYGYSKYQSHVPRAGASLNEPRVNEAVASRNARTEALATTAFLASGNGANSFTVRRARELIVASSNPAFESGRAEERRAAQRER